MHSIVVFANDTVGNIGSSSMVLFSIIAPSPSPSPSPTLRPTPSQTLQPTPSVTLQPTASSSPSPTPQKQIGFLGTTLPIEYGYAIVAFVIIAVVGLALFVYFRKRGNSLREGKELLRVFQSDVNRSIQLSR
jgi:hypothetical protein